MRERRWAVPLAVLLLAGADVGGARAQDQVSGETSSWRGLSEEQAEFLRESRRATEDYHDLAAAVADGFRPVGADAPAMGRHWVSLKRLFDGEIDAARPEILMYAAVDGRDSLVGIGFGYVVGPEERETPPANPFGQDYWHVHSGRLDMESHRMDHVGDGLPGAGAVAHGSSAGAGVSVLHGWVWVDNPAGVLEPNNWVLPYIRLGLSRPEHATPEVDFAVSLASVGADFFIAWEELFAGLEPDPANGRVEALRRAENEVAAWWLARPGESLTSAEIEWLGRLWRRLGLRAHR